MLEATRDLGLQRLYPGNWVGTLVLPDAAHRDAGGDVFLRVEQAPPESAALVGRQIKLHWADAPQLPNAQTSVRFGDQTAASKKQGNVHPDRVDGWDGVSPLESLAGGRAQNDVRVLLPAGSQLSADERTLSIADSPTEIDATHLALARIDSAQSGQLHVTLQNGAKVDLPVDLAEKRYDVTKMAGQDVFLAGLPGAAGFEVKSIRPRDLLQVAPQRRLQGREACEKYLRDEMWADPAGKVGTSERVLLSPSGRVAPFVEGEKYLLVHVYGEVRGQFGDATRPLGVVPGHFSYGTASVGENPLTQDPEFSLRYRQIYAHGPDGILSGAQDWDAYMGDVDSGRFPNRPVCDIVVRHPALQQTHEIAGHRFDFFAALEEETSRIEARYRTGDGDGLAKVTAFTSCTQDSAQAMYAVLRRLQSMSRDAEVKAWLKANPRDPRTSQFKSLLGLAKDLKNIYSPLLGIAPTPWRQNVAGVASSAPPLGALGAAVTRAVDATLTSKTIFPRQHQDEVSRALLRHDADLMVLRSNGLAFPRDSWPAGPNYPFASRYDG